jgi:hypothetical protein
MNIAVGLEDCEEEDDTAVILTFPCMQRLGFADWQQGPTCRRIEMVAKLICLGPQIDRR